MQNTHGFFMFPRELGELELTALVLHIMRQTGAELRYSIVSTATIKAGPKGVHQETKARGPLRGTVAFSSGELIDFEGIGSTVLREYQLIGLRSSYGSSNIEGMRESLIAAHQQIEDAIKSYFQG